MSKRISNNTGKKGMLNNTPKPLLGTGMIIGLIVSGVLIIGIILIIVWQTGGFDTKNPPPPTTPPPTTPPPTTPPPVGNTPTKQPVGNTPTQRPVDTPPPGSTPATGTSRTLIDSSKLDPTKTSIDWKNNGIVNVSIKGKLGTSYNNKFQLQFFDKNVDNYQINNFNPSIVTPHQIFNDLQEISVSPPFLIKSLDGKYLHTLHFTEAGGGNYYHTVFQTNLNTNAIFQLYKYPDNSENTYKLYSTRKLWITSQYPLGSGKADSGNMYYDNQVFCDKDETVDDSPFGKGACMWEIKILD
jgi:hypothetical protein